MNPGRFPYRQISLAIISDRGVRFRTRRERKLCVRSRQILLCRYLEEGFTTNELRASRLNFRRGVSGLFMQKWGTKG